MADTAALKLGNLISSKISGTLGSFASGLKGSFIGANPAVFGPMAGILSKGFGSLTKQTQIQAKTQQEQTQRESGFREEADNERKRYEQILLSVQKGMAINIEAIQKDVREILELMKKDSFWDKIKGILASLAALLPRFKNFLKGIPDLIKKFFKNIGDWFKRLKLPSFDDFLKRIKNWFGKFKLPSFDDFLKRIKGFFDVKFPKISNFFGKIRDWFDRIKFPETKKIFSEWLSNLRKALKLDDLASIFKLDKLKEIFKFDNLKDLFKFDTTESKARLGKLKGGIFGFFKSLEDGLDLLKLDMFVRFQNLKTTFAESMKNVGKAITESDLFKSIRTLFGDVKTKFGTFATSLDNLRVGILDSLRNAVRTFGESNLAKSFGLVADDIGRIGKTIAAPFMTLGDAIAKDVNQIRDTFRASVRPVAAVGDVADTVRDVAKVGDVVDTARDVAKVGDVVDTARDVAKVGDALDAIRDTEKITDAVKSVGLLGGIFAKIGDIGKGIGALFAGPLKLFAELTDVTPFLKTVGKVLGPIGLIMSIFDGLALAFNTEKLQKYFGKEDIGMQQRISGFIGGFIGGFGGLIDMLAGAMGFDNTTIQEDMSEGITLKVNDMFNGLKAMLMFIGDLIKSEPAKALFAAIGGAVENATKLFKVLAELFTSEPMMKVYETIGKIAAKLSETLFKSVGNMFDILVGIFTLDFSKVKTAGIDLMDTIWKGVKGLAQILIDALAPAFVTTVNWLIDQLADVIPLFGDKIRKMKIGDEGKIETSKQKVSEIESRITSREKELEGYIIPASTPEETDTFISGKTGPEADRIRTELNDLYKQRDAAKDELRTAQTKVSSPRDTSSATPVKSQMPVLPPAPSVGPEAGRGYKRYSEADLVKEGLKIKPGFTQVAGSEIHPNTVAAAKTIQNAFQIERFTGFNDGYVRREHGAADAHKKGLAFDFTVPRELAQDDAYRNGLVESVRKAGFFIIDEYAYPQSKTTAGHFHVELGRGPGKQVGQGKYSIGGADGADPSKMRPVPRSPVEGNGPSAGGDGDASVSYDTTETAKFLRQYGTGNAVPNAQAGTTPAQRAGAPTMPGQPQVRVIVQPKILSAEEALDYAQRIAYYDAEKKRYDEEKKYRDERARLENKFYGDLESMVRPMVTALQGPAGSMDPALAKDAGKNLAAGMQADFTKLGTTLFGKQYGAAMGTTFQQLAGSYLDQFINQALAPAMGVDAEVLNRSINLYAKGKEFASKTLAPAQKALDDAKTALQAKEKEVGISKASIIRASGLGKSLSADQLSKIAQLETMRKGVTEQESKVNALKKQRKQYNQVALEDMFFGMTGVPTGPRSLIEQYGGADALTRDLATMIGAPFSPAFHLGEKGPLTGPGVDPRIALDQRLKETENFVQVISVKTAESAVQGHKEGGDIVHEKTLDAHRQGAYLLSESIRNNRVELGTTTGNAMDVFTSSVGESVKSAFGDILPTFMDFDQVAAGGGTAIPGYVESDRETAKFLRQAGAGGVGMMAGGPSRLPANTGKLMDFGQNMLYNMLGSKVSSAVGGGMGGNILGRAAQGALKGAFSGGDIVQNIGAQFGMKLAPGAGFGDLFGAFNSMANSPFAGIAKTGMNMMQSLMPGGATGPMGQFGFDFFSGMGSGGNFMSNLGSAMSSGGSFMGSFGANAAGTGMNLGNFAGQAAGALGPIMQGMQYGDMAKKLIGGQYQVSKGLDTFYKAGSAVASAIMGPIGGALVGAVSGGINRLFGRKPKETKAEGFSGTFSTEGADVKQFSDWFQKGGVFRSDKRGTELTSLDAETAKAFSDTVKDTTKTVESLGKVLGYDPTKTKGFSKAVKIDLKGLNEKQQQEAIQKAFKDYGASLVGSSFKYVGKFTKTGEDQLDALSRMASASETFKSVMTGPDVKKILGLDNADMIKNLVGPQFAGITNMDAAIKDYLGGGKGMMETSATGTIGLFDTAFTNVFSKLNLDPVGDVAQNIISAFTGSLQDQAGSLQEYLNTYIADFQSQLIEAYGGAEEFQKVESSLFDLLYTEEEKKAKLQELTAAQMKEAAQKLKDAGVAIDPDKLGASFKDNQDAAKNMLKAADADLASGKITKEQYATIRKSAADFLTAAKKNSELGGVAGAARKDISAEDAAKYMFPIQTAVASGTKSIAQTSAAAANTIATASVEGSDNIAASTLSTANTVSSTTLATANTISTGLSSYNTTLEQLITNFYNSSQVFNGSILTLNTSISELGGGVGGLGGSVDGVSTSVGSVSEGLSSAVSAAAAAVSAAVSAVSDAVSDAVSAATSAVSAAVSAVSDAVSDAVSSNAIGDAAAEGGNTAASAAAAAASATAAGDDGSASDGGAGGGGGDGGGDGGASGCVDPEVPLYISSTETKSAGDVVIGDYMYTVHEKTLEYGMYKVINAQIIIQDKIIVTFDDDTTMKISTTHKFLLSDGSWKEMYLLDVGAQIQTMHGVNERGYKTITRIEDIGDGEVVLLTVEDAHTYIADGLISHNMKARGGSVRKTKSYIVGEVGPEIFVPNMAGTIIPTHRIIEAVQNASALDTQTRNLLMNAAPAPNPISMAYLAQENAKKSIEHERDTSGSVNNAVVDNSVTQVSSPQTTVINSGGDVRSNHPISGMFTRSMIGARSFGS